MKEAHNKLDDLFKSALGDYKQEPSPQLIKKLNNKLLFRDIIHLNFKNIFSSSIVKYSSILLITVVAIFVALHFYNDQSNENSIKTMSQTNINPEKKYDLNNNIQNDASKNNNNDGNKQMKSDSPEAGNNNVSANQNLSNNKTNIIVPINSSNNKENKTNLSESNTNGLKNKSKDSPVNVNIVKNNQTEKDISKNETKNTINKKTNIDLSSNNTNKKFESIKITEVNKNFQSKTDSSNDVYYTGDYKNLNFKISTIQPKPAFTIKNEGEVTTSDFITIDNGSKTSLKTSSKSPKYIVPKYTIELYGGGDYVNKILSSSLNSYISERKNTEKSIYTYNLGADIKYTIKNTFVQAGVNKSVYGENLVLTEITHLMDSSASHYYYENHQIITIDTTGWIPVWDSIQWDSIPIIDTNVYNYRDSSWVSIYDSINKENKYNIKNRINYIEIPVLIGFNFGNSPLRYNVSTGVSFGFLTNSSGKLIRPFTNDVSDFNKTYFPFNKIIYNYILRAGCFYKIDDRWGVFIRGSFKYNINSIFDKSYPVNQKYYTIGLQGGISIDL